MRDHHRPGSEQRRRHGGAEHPHPGQPGRHGDHERARRGAEELSVSGVKDALKNGEFDAQENPVPVIYSNRLYEAQNYLAITSHSYDAMPLTIRKDIWDGLPEAYQEILTDAALEARDMDRSLVVQQSADCVKLLEEEGMTVTYPELEDFISATRGVVHVFSDVYGKELLSEISG